MRTAARELGLRPREFELAVQLGEVCTVPGAVEGPRRVPREEVERLTASDGLLLGLRGRLRTVGGAEGAELLGIGRSRFARLARAGCFSPVRFYVNRYRTVVWLYLADELRDFAQRCPSLLSGTAPEELRSLLKEGADQRPRHWRGRRVGQLVRQASGPWERAAARAVVLDEDALAQAVPDPAERARLAGLRPELTPVRELAVATRQTVRELCLATGEDEILWHRLMLVADLEDARTAESPGGATIEVAEVADAPSAAGASAASSAAPATHGCPAPPPRDTDEDGATAADALAARPVAAAAQAGPSPAAAPPGSRAGHQARGGPGRGKQGHCTTPGARRSRGLRGWLRRSTAPRHPAC